MFKKIIVASAIALVAASTSFADAAPYIGAGIGIVNNTNTVTANGSSFTGGAYRGIPLNLSLGYGGSIGQSAYLGGEVFGTVGTANISANTQLKTSYGYGASILPGLIIADRTMVFARLGVIESHFQTNNDSRVGGEFGLGSQIALTQQIDIRGEYDFVAYEAKNETSGAATSSVAPRSDQFNLGLIYKFE
ncbi:MAG: hypothetical protein A3F43_02025 [Gammaproteobacteria bacterium RIFCSPHIGHO2_12_FULL_42_10]|nr:MAG: hypothetical protein A3F43_02025 [Gammaproteobacteria bacterium RIFCSPHIGHO2_12_FULL_42_10]